MGSSNTQCIDALEYCSLLMTCMCSKTFLCEFYVVYNMTYAGCTESVNDVQKQLKLTK